jgi:hypothetical protein
MIAEIIPEAYDVMGKQVSQPFHGRKGPHPTFPIGRYVSQPLTVHCKSFEEMRQFLRGCRGVSDEKLFGKRDYWQPPEEFEKRRAGDCEDFSFWAWRQLMDMGFDARVVFGRHGRYGIGHAWTEFFRDGKCFLLEPQARGLGLHLPRLSTLAYEPKFSVAWNGDHLTYFAHSQPDSHIHWGRFARMMPEWLAVWGWYWIRLPYYLSRRLYRRIWRTRSPN